MVVFNALQTSLSGGIGRYCYELSKAIYNKHDIDFKIVIREEDKKLYDFVNLNDLIIVSNIKNSRDRNYYEQIVLPKQVYKKYPKAILHYPDTMAPLFARNKVVITVHDLAFKSLKGAFTHKTMVWKNIITNLSIKKADKIIAITKFSQSEIKRYYPKFIDKVSVVYNGFNDFSRDHIDYTNIRKDILKYEKTPYLLTVSTISPRKNVDGLIKAFDLIKDKIPHKLIVAGKKGWMYEDVINLVKELNLSERVFFTDQINDDELKFLYKNSKLFIYPSFYEGFGLPPLEAMSYGVPTVVSNRTSIPEVCSDAAEYIEPSDWQDIADKIFRLLNDKERIEFLKSKGYERMKVFSWEKCGEDVLKVYKIIL